MKKIFFAVALAMTTFSIAQTTKGKWLVGGASTVNFNSTNQTFEFDDTEVRENSTSTFNFALEGGNFISNNIAIGLSLSYSTSKSEVEVSNPFFDNEFESKISTFSVLPFAQYYFSTDSKIQPYLGTQAGYSLISTGEEDFNKTSGFSYGGRAGLAYFINSTVSIDLRVDYLRTTLSNKENDDAKDKLKSLTVGIGAFLYL